MPFEMTGIILAGGKNSRIKRKKAFIQLPGGFSIIENTVAIFKRIFSEVIIITNQPERYEKFRVRTVSDLIQGKGPLGGIFTGLCFSRNEHNFFVACDMPWINPSLIKYILKKPKDYQVVIPQPKGKSEPLFARYSKSCLPVVFSHLQKERLKIRDIFKDLEVLKISPGEIKRFDPKGHSFLNINTEKDLKRVLKILSSQK